MRKHFLLAFISLLFITKPVLSAVLPPAQPTQPPIELIHIGYGVRIPFDQVLTLTPKEYRKLTGHRMGIIKKIAFKSIQKKLKKMQPYSDGSKSQTTAILLAFFLGGIGIHRFYLGYTWQGIVQVLTLGGFGIWALIDFVRIVMGRLKPKNGEYR